MVAETALCASLLRNADALPHDIIAGRGVTTHLCYDNWDNFEETLTGADTSHSTHGIVIQDYADIDSSTIFTLNEIPHTKNRSIDFVPQPNLDYIITHNDHKKL